MEWVETTGKSLEEAKDRALDQLGVAHDEAEFEVLEEPKTGLFGRVRGEARVRARIRPTAARPKQDRRSRGKAKSKRDDQGGSAEATTATKATDPAESKSERDGDRDPDRNSRKANPRPESKQSGPAQVKETSMSSDEFQDPSVTPEQVGEAALAFMSGLAHALGVDATASVTIEGTDLDVHLDGPGLGLLVGPGGNTLVAVQDLARVAAQRRLGDHETRLKVDVAGYRQRRGEALEKFTHTVANQVLEQGIAKALEPMSSADRKVVHDTVVGIDGVTSHSEGDDPSRRVIITPG